MKISKHLLSGSLLVVAVLLSLGTTAKAAGPVTQLIWSTEPDGATNGQPFSTQPVLETADQTGAPSTVGLAATQMVTVTLSSGTGPIVGTTNYNIGTAGGNGVVTFSDLRINSTGTKQLTASSPGYGTPVSGMNVWLDASVASSVNISSGNVTQWNDLSGNGFNFADNNDVGGAGFIGYTNHSTPSGRSTVTFTGQNGLLNQTYANTGSNVTVMLVTKKTLPGTTIGGQYQGPFAANGAGFNDYNNAQGFCLDYGGTENTPQVERHSPDSYGTYEPSAAYHMFEYVGTYTNNTIWIDGNGGENGGGAETNFDISNLAVGARLNAGPAGNNYFGGDIAEVLVYNTALDTADRQANETYFTNKWLSTGYIPGTFLTNAVSTSFMVAQAQALVSIESAANGSGAVIPAQNLAAGTVTNVYAIVRNGSGIFLSNAVVSWSLVSTTGGVVSGDLVPAVDNKSATFTAHLAGSAVIQAVLGPHTGLSGVQTVVAGAASQTTVETAANGGGVVVPAQNLAAGSSVNLYAIARDVEGNFLSNTVATWSLVSTTGAVAGGDLVPAANNESATFTGHLLGSGVVQAVANTFAGHSGAITVNTGGPVTQLIWSTQPGAAAYGQPFGQQPVLETADQYGNPTTSGLPATLNVTVNLTQGTGPLLGTTNYNIGTSGGNGVVAFNNLKIGTTGANKQLTASVPIGYGSPVSGMKVWLDANNASTVLVNGSGSVTNWLDLSGNGNNFNTILGTGFIANNNTGTPSGRRTITFPGTGSLMNTTYLNQTNMISIFIVSKYAVSGVGGLNNAGPMSGTDGVNDDYTSQDNFDFNYQNNNPPTPVYERTATANWGQYDPGLAYHDLEGISTGSGNTIYINGSGPVTSTAYVGNFNVNHLSIGGRLNGAAGQSYDHADIAEVLVYNTALSTASRQADETYLSNKWISAASPSYSFISNAVTTTFTVSPATITITNGIAANSMMYNGSTNATLAIGTVGFSGVLPQDAGNVAVNTSAAAGYFANAGPGNNIPVTVTGLTLTGSAAGNYVVAPLILSANITPPVAGFTAFTINGAGSATAGAGDLLTISAVTNGAVETKVDGIVYVTFSGLSAAPDGTLPTVTDVNGTPQPFGTAMVLFFTNGVASMANGAGVLTAYDAQTASPHITDGINTDAGPGGSTVSITVSAGPNSAYRVSAATLTPQVGASDALTLNLIDRYQNPSATTGGKTITFGGLSAGPNGSLPTVNGTAFGTGTSVSFSGGSASVSLVAVKVENNKLLTATDGTLSAASTGGTAPTLSPTVGAAARLGIITQPSTTATVGAVLATQPAIAVLDEYGNPVTGSSAPISVNAAVGNVTGTFPTNAVGGVATFSGLSLTNAGMNTLTFTSSGLTPTNSAQIKVSSGAFTALAWVTQPGAAVYSTVFGNQPVLATVDQYGNPTTNGLGTNLPVTITLTSGPGTLSGTTSYNIGSAGNNGVVNFTNLSINAVNNNFVLTASTILSGASAPPVSGAAVWLDASDSSSIIGAPAVTQWNDKSGNNYNFGIVPGGASGTIYYTNTLNGHGVVTFPNGPALVTTNNAYTFTGTSLTLFCVVRAPAGSFGNYEGPFGSIAAGQNEDWDSPGSWSLNSGGSGNPTFQQNGNSVNSPIQVTSGNPFIWEAADNSTGDQDLVGYEDASTNVVTPGTPGSTGPFAITQLAVGARLSSPGSILNVWNGDVAEVLLYNSLLTTNQQAQINTYLYNKWLGNGAPPLSTATAPFTVSPAPVVITNGITADNQVYNGTTNATLTIGTVGFSGVLPQDAGNVGVNTAGATGYFANAGPGNNIPVTVTGITLTGSAAGDYAVAPLTLSADITPLAGKEPVGINLAGGAVKVSFDGVAGTNYIVERSTNLSVGAGWVPISTNSSTSNTVFTITDSFPDIGSRPRTALYRVLVP